jgi:hypothetical protein
MYLVSFSSLKTCTAVSYYLFRLRLQTNRNKCKLPTRISFVINSGRTESRARPDAHRTAAPRRAVPCRAVPRLGNVTPSTGTVIFVFHIAAWELLQLKQACLIGGNLHKILMITVIYKLNVFTDELRSLKSE